MPRSSHCIVRVPTSSLGVALRPKLYLGLEIEQCTEVYFLITSSMEGDLRPEVGIRLEIFNVLTQSYLCPKAGFIRKAIIPEVGLRL